MSTFVVIDLEMPNSYAGRVSAIGITVIRDGKIGESFFSLVNPECQFEEYTIQLTGISPEKVADAPTFPEIWETVKAYLEQGILVAHAAESDLYVLSRCLIHYGITWQATVPYLCTMQACRETFPLLGHYGLDFLCQSLRVPLNHHHADSDAAAAACLLQKCMENGYLPERHINTYDLENGHREKKKNENRASVRVRQHLISMRSNTCKTRQAHLLPDVEPDKFLGVPIPMLRRYATQLSKTATAGQFMECLPHEYYEEYVLHAFLINQKRHYGLCLGELERFLPSLPFTTVVPLLHPKCFARAGDFLLPVLTEWLYSDTENIKIFALNMLTEYFTDLYFSEKTFSEVARTDFSVTPVRHAGVLYFSQALVFHFDTVLPLLKQLPRTEGMPTSVIIRALKNNRLTKTQKQELSSLTEFFSLQ